MAAAVVALAACGSSSSSSAPAPTSTTAAVGSGWVDQPVTFSAGGLQIYATYRHPVSSTASFPAALLIAGSGPTDRNGNSALENGPVDTLQTVADWLSADGVASLRYDKLGSGQTGLGSYAGRPAAIGIAPFEEESAAAMNFLAAQRGVDRSRLAVIGHSEGALFALLLATGAAGPTPHVAAVGLLEPLSERYLDIISTQVMASVAAATKAGQLTSAQGARIDSSLTSAVASLRTSGTVPNDLPSSLTSVLNPTTALFLSQTDRYDPAQLAADLPARTAVLVTCSNADVQVSCAEVNHLVGGLTRGGAATDFVHLTGVDHVLKQDPTGSPSNYTMPLPFSPQLQRALAAFAAQHLTG